MLFDEIDGVGIPKTRVDCPVEQMPTVEDVVDGEANGQPQQILVLDIEARDPRQIQRSVYLRQEVIFRVVAILEIGAPGERRARNVVTDLSIAPEILDAADRALLAGQRIAHRGPFPAHREVQLGTLPANRIELEGTDAFRANPGGLRKVADPLAVFADWDDVDDVLNPVIVEVEASFAPRPEVAGELRFDLPALRWDEIGIASVLPVLAELGLRKEVVEADLTDPATKLQANVPTFGRAPPQGEAPLRSEELAGRLEVVDPIQLRDFGSGCKLQVQVRRKRATVRRDAFVSYFRDLAGSLREWNLDELLLWIELEQPALLVERVECPLE